VTATAAAASALSWATVTPEKPTVLAAGQTVGNLAQVGRLRNTDKVVGRTVDATTGEIASELQEALKGWGAARAARPRPAIG
jgi:hypothetical protein